MLISILCTISLAPPTLINHKLCEVNYYFFAFIAKAQDMHFGYINMKNIPCIAYCVTSKTTKFYRGSTSENHTFDSDTC